MSNKLAKMQYQASVSFKGFLRTKIDTIEFAFDIALNYQQSSQVQARGLSSF